jgi:hypothetical protein
MRTSIISGRQIVSVVMLAVAIASSGGGWAQAYDNAIHLVPGSPAPNPGEQLAVVLVDVRDSGTMPAMINLKAGRILLVVTNASKNTATAGVVIDPGSVGDLKLGLTPLLSLGSSAVVDQNQRSAGVLVGVVGEFDLKDAVTGKILSRIVFK